MSGGRGRRRNRGYREYILRCVKIIEDLKVFICFCRGFIKLGFLVLLFRLRVFYS